MNMKNAFLRAAAQVRRVSSTHKLAGVFVSILAGATWPFHFTEAATTGESATYVVSLQLAKAVAQTHPAVVIRGKKHAVQSYSVLTDTKSQPAAYGLNFGGGGWAIISATLNINPVLAFSDKGFIELADLPTGPKEWVDGVRAAVDETRASEESADTAVRERVALLRQLSADWTQAMEVIEASHEAANAEEISHARVILRQRSELNNGAVAPPGCNDVAGGPSVGCNPPPPEPEPGPPPTACHLVAYPNPEPLIKTQWDQGCNYNTYTPGRDTGPSACGRALTGCGPTAAGQVMRYWQRAWGQNYNWAGMYNDNTWSAGRADLLSDIGVAAQSNYYDDSGTSTTMANLQNALNQFGYWTSKVAFTGVPLRSTIAPTEIAAGRPVILRGKSSGGGHLWVADGFKKPIYSGTNCSTPPYPPMYVYYNWGWGGDHNGWYSDFDFKNEVGDFSHSRYFITVSPK